MAKEVTRRQDNYSQWYNDLVVKADLAEQSAVRGCMVIKPYGYAIWEKMQHILDGMFKETGAQERLLPPVHPQVLLQPGGRACGRLRQGMRRGDAPPPDERPQRKRRRRGPGSETGGGAHRAPDVRDHHLEHLQELDPLLAGPAHPVQPVGERRALGDAHPPVPPHRGVPLAGRTHRPRHRRRGRGREAAHGGRLRPLCP